MDPITDEPAQLTILFVRRKTAGECDLELQVDLLRMGDGFNDGFMSSTDWISINQLSESI
ncbi:MAG: hypothetical protein U0X76_03965 [Bacteroidia bacterium]